MAGLPPGWEWDYDGTRWFYKYKPNGHVQYHFPTEGDEFPDFVVDGAPDPGLAPEERLESQQQVRRQTSTSEGTRSTARNSASGRNKTQMTAVARPVSSMWEDDVDVQDDGVFQPENFMYLGPGTYTDVSPLADEEEEAARRIVAGSGGIGARIEGSAGKGVSPLASAGTTPQIHTSELDASTKPSGLDSTQEEMQQPEIHMLDSREMPHELPVEEPRRFNPVGVVAEMATEHTAPARAETHPDPVEMADNMVLAPIETAVPPGFAELPERSSPVEKRSDDKRKEKEKMEVKVAQNEAAAVYQAYKPADATIHASQSAVQDGKQRQKRTSIQREASLMMGPKPRSPPKLDHPPILSLPTKPPEDSQPPPKTGGFVIDSQPLPQEPQNRASSSSGQGRAAGDLSHIPSVLKPARNTSSTMPLAGTGNPGPSRSDAIEGTEQKQGISGLGKFPSVLKPARGRAPSQPGEQPQLQQQQPSQNDYHPGIQRVSTLPDQLPSQSQQPPSQGAFLPYRNQNAAPGPQQPLPHQQIRPASVMPAFGYGTYHPLSQPREQRHQMRDQVGTLPWPAANMPPLVQSQGFSSTAPPPSGQMAPFNVPTEPPPGSVTMPITQHQIQRLDAYPGDSVPGALGMAGTFYGQSSDSPPSAHNNRRHSSFVGSEVSPLTSRNGSTSSTFPMQYPSPIEHSRRESSSLGQGVAYTPSPVSQTSQSLGPSPTPPSTTSGSRHGSVSQAPPVPGKFPAPEKGSYFPSQPSDRRGHVGTAQSPGFPSPRAQTQPTTGGLQRSQSLTRPAQSPPSTQGPQRPPKPITSQSLQQSDPLNSVPLGRIVEHHDEPTAMSSEHSKQEKRNTSNYSQPLHDTGILPVVPGKVPLLVSDEGRIPGSQQSIPPQQRHQRKPIPDHVPAQISQQQVLQQGHDGGVSQGIGTQQMHIFANNTQSHSQVPQGGSPMVPIPPQAVNLMPQRPHQQNPSYGPPPPGLVIQTQMNNMVNAGPVSPPGIQSAQGRMQGQGFSGQNQWQAYTTPPSAHGSHPNSVPQQMVSGPGQQKEKKWLKWLKGGPKSSSHSTPSQPPGMSPFTVVPDGSYSPAVQTRPTWGGADFSQRPVWQPGQPIQSQIQPELKQNAAASQLTQYPQGSDADSNLSSLAPARLGQAPATGQAASAILDSSASQKSDGLSDTASTSTILEVAEAKSQPVLRPHIVQVQSKPQDVQFGHRARASHESQEGAPHIQAQGRSHSDKHIRTVSAATVTQQQVYPVLEGGTSLSGDPGLAPAPLFSGPNSPTSPSSKRNNEEREVETPGKSNISSAAAKWNRKPVVDYSGDDWGEEHDWRGG